MAYKARRRTTPPAVDKNTLEQEIQTLNSRMMQMRRGPWNLEFEEAKTSAGSGMDLPDFLLMPRGVPNVPHGMTVMLLWIG